MALTACTNQSGMAPSSPSAMAPTAAQASPTALKTCATSPPQYQWIFAGACQKFDVDATGGTFSLGEYQGITVKGSIGKNTAKGTVKIALADALDKNGDIETYNGKAFPPYKGKGTTYFYASAVNQSTQVFKPIVVRDQPVFQYTITNAKGFGDANRCSAAVLTFRSNGKATWDPLPESGEVKGETATISQYAAPPGLELLPKIPLYFATSCYKQ